MNPEGYKENIKVPDIAQEITKMYEADQAMRTAWEVGDFSGENLDVIHTDRMKQIVNEIGWPTVSKVGKVVAENAWALVQHSDHDVTFQAMCLQLMKEAPTGEVAKKDLAYLEDRVRVNQKQGQLYGTQFREQDSKHAPCPIEDEENVDVRRVEVGLDTLAEAIAHMNEKYPLKKEGG